MLNLAIANIKASYAVAAEISPPWGNMAPKLDGRRGLQVHGRHMIQATGSLMYDIPPNCALGEPSIFGRARVSYSSMGKSWPGYATNQRQPRRQSVLATRRSTTSGCPRAAFMSQASLSFTICDFALEFTYRKIPPHRYQAAEVPAGPR